jgi:hypothetical protein
MSTMRKSRAHKGRSDKSAPAANARSNPPVAPEKKRRRWVPWILASICLVAGAYITYGLVDNVLWPCIPASLVGTWRVQGGPQDGVTLDFQPNGDFQARLALGGKGGVVHARAELDQADDKVLRIVATDPQSGQRTTKVHIIRLLTQNELHLEDPTGTVSRLVRLELPS